MSPTPTPARRPYRRLAAFLPGLVLVGASVGVAGLLNTEPAAATKPVPDASDFKPTAEVPLPPMGSVLNFNLSDEPSYWYDNGRKDLEGFLHTRSVAAGVGTTKVKFDVAEPFTSENHTVTSIVYPTGAKNMPFIQQGSFTGEKEVELSTPGLYAFQCRVHPYMLGAVVIDDPLTKGADFGKSIHWIDGTDMPSFSDEILRVVRSFFIVTQPANWQVYDAERPTVWDPSYPAAPIMTYDADGNEHFIPNLDTFFGEMFKEPITLQPPVAPKSAGVGEAWVDTQWEKSAGKTKPGSMTAFDTETWKVKKKFFLPSVNLNNPHNMWSNFDGTLMHQTNWFSDKITTIDYESGAVVNELEVGPSPSHIVTRPNNGNLIVPNNGGNRIVEVSPDGKEIVKSYLTQKPGENPAFPHAHWVSFDGKYVVTPNSNESTASIFDLDVPSMMKPVSGGFPVATSMSNDGKRSYVANLLDHTITCLSNEAPACPSGEQRHGKTGDTGGPLLATSKIDLRQNYDKITGKSTGPFGISPIQIPISPDDQYMLSVGTFTGNIQVIDMETHKIVKSLACGPGCHGINFGAKKGGGYFGYVSIKFANKFIVVDGDPNGDGDPADAEVAGEMLTNAVDSTKMDDKPVANLGQGGNGVFAYPIPYNGWVQKMPEAWKAKLTCAQQAPLLNPLC